MKTKIIMAVIMLAVLLVCPRYVFGQNFSRVLELTAKRMNGPDVEALQKRLLNLGFAGVGEADGYYGPRSEEIIKTIQKFAGFEESGKVDRALWNFIFGNDESNIKNWMLTKTE